jgi:hypothetical protein
MPKAQLLEYAGKWTAAEKDYFRPLIIAEKLRLRNINDTKKSSNKSPGA